MKGSIKPRILGECGVLYFKKSVAREHYQNNDTVKFLIIMLLVPLIIIATDANLVSEDSRWVVYFSEKGNVYTYDKQSLVRVSRDNISVWEKMNFTDEFREMLSNKLPAEVKNHREINCKTRMTRILTSYSDGLPKERLDDGWYGIVPESPTEKLYDVVCRIKKE